MSAREFKPKSRPRPGRPFDKGRKSAPGPRWRRRDDGGTDEPVILYGWHSVTFALKNPSRRIRKLWLTENAARRLAEENIDRRVVPEIVRPQEIDRRVS